MIIDDICNNNFEAIGRKNIYTDSLDEMEEEISKLLNKLKEKTGEIDLINEVEGAVVSAIGNTSEAYFKFGMAMGIKLIFEANEIASSYNEE